jgi:hypothetical protein
VVVHRAEELDERAIAQAQVMLEVGCEGGDAIAHVDHAARQGHSQGGVAADIDVVAAAHAGHQRRRRAHGLRRRCRGLIKRPELATPPETHRGPDSGAVRARATDREVDPPSGLGELLGYLASGRAGSHEQTRRRRQLRRVAVIGGVKLRKIVRQRCRDVWQARPLVRTARQDDVASFDVARRRHDDVSSVVSTASQSRDIDAERTGAWIRAA